MSVQQKVALLKQRGAMLTSVARALETNTPLDWTVQEYLSYRRQLNDLGYTVVTRGQAIGKGYQVVQASKPFVNAQLPQTPMGETTPLYMLEFHCMPREIPINGHVERETSEGLLNSREAALYINYSKKTMDTWRWKRIGPRYIKVNGRIYYDQADLDEWFAANVMPQAS